MKNESALAFVHSAHCEAWILCEECRCSAPFRESLHQQRAVPEVDFPCPYGFSAEAFPAKPLHPPILNVINSTPVYDLTRLWGTRFWEILHLRALVLKTDDTEWLRQFSGRIPCEECRDYWNRDVQANPPDWTCYFHWTVKRHNSVNRHLGKREIPLKEAVPIWEKKLHSLGQKPLPCL